MADDEQFSLCWNNFNSNLSAGFHESLCRGDLVDVTLAAEGQFVKAHRLVLSVCSPYFRKMFTQMPANQHAFVFLKDVSHTALKDLIQFMYCGEVNVKQEALPAFISTAEALQIKGLTDSDPPPQAPAETHTQPPTTQIHTPLRTRQRSTTTRTYKLETVDDTDDDQQTTHHTVPTKPQTTQIVIQTTAPTSSISTQQQHLQQVVQQATVQQITPAATTSVATTQKRPLRNSGGPNVKRTKNTSTTSSTMVDPLETATETITSQPQQITVQTTLVSTPSSSKTEPIAADTTEYIDLPLELPSTKSEPEYVEDAGDQDNDQDGAYVEDDTYGDIRYDESYFTEGEDGGNVSTGAGNTSTATTSKAVVKQQQSSFSDSSFAAGESGDQTNNDTQGVRKQATSQSKLSLVKHAPPKSFLRYQVKTLRSKSDTNTPGKIIRNPTIRSNDTIIGRKVTLDSLNPNVPENILKTAANNHNLTRIKMPRLRGQCVHCLVNQKPNPNVIFTYCDRCPGKVWMCEECFDKIHEETHVKDIYSTNVSDK